MAASQAPILWHIAVSHFSEKARWALDHKSLAHVRRAPAPGLHILYALWLTRGRAFTLPILELQGERIAGSGAIIAALEQHMPEPPLYPADLGLLTRALELADWFDSELGPHVRRLVFYELRRDREALAEIGRRAVPELTRAMGPLGVPYTRALTALRYGAADPQAAERARVKIIAALDRLERELDGGDYLVGGRFGVADLTAAALLYPLVLPPEAPPATERLPEPLESFRATLRERPAYAWVEKMFRRHRRRSPGAAPSGVLDRGDGQGVPTAAG